MSNCCYQLQRKPRAHPVVWDLWAKSIEVLASPMSLDEGPLAVMYVVTKDRRIVAM